MPITIKGPGTFIEWIVVIRGICASVLIINLARFEHVYSDDLP
jgi:hypothetical protein